MGNLSKQIFLKIRYTSDKEIFENIFNTTKHRGIGSQTQGDLASFQQEQL